MIFIYFFFFFFFQAEDGIRDLYVTGVQTCALPISRRSPRPLARALVDEAHGSVARSEFLDDRLEGVRRAGGQLPRSGAAEGGHRADPAAGTPPRQIGRASCRERV